MPVQIRPAADFIWLPDARDLPTIREQAVLHQERSNKESKIAAVSHPHRHHSGGAGTAWQQRWTHLSPPAGGKGIPKGRVPLALPRAGAARRAGEKRKTFSLASINRYTDENNVLVRSLCKKNFLTFLERQRDVIHKIRQEGDRTGNFGLADFV